jgi:formamidopyrimidine-DNA glycosylase
MPELPEVEVMRMGLEKALLGKVFLKVKINNLKIVSGSGTKRIEDKKKGKEFEEEVLRKKIVSIKRRAKNIIINFVFEKMFIIK